MSDINANIVVTQNEITISTSNDEIVITPNPLNMNIFTNDSAPGGYPGDIQYNANGLLGGVPTANYVNGNLSLGNNTNLKITGGSNAYFLQTDGTGNLTWAPGTANVSGSGTAAGANNQIQLSDGSGNFKSGPGFTFDTASNLFSTPGNIFATGNANITNNLVIGGNANITGNVSASYYFGNGAFLTGIDTSLISNGNSNVKVYANSNVAISVTGVSNTVIFTDTGINANGYLTVTGNTTAGNLIGPLANGNSNVRVYANDSVMFSLAGVSNRARFETDSAKFVNYGLVVSNTSNGDKGIYVDNGRISMFLDNQTLAIISATYNNSSIETGEWDYYRARGNNASPLPVLPNDIISNIRSYCYADAGNTNFTTTTARDIVDSNDGNGNLSSTYEIRKWGTSDDKIQLYTPLVKVTSNGSNNTLLYGNGYITTIGNINGNILTGNLLTGTLTTANQPNITNVGTLGNLSVSGNITSGNANLGNLLVANYIQGTLTTNAQPNITSVGNLTSLTVTGNTISGNINGGNLVQANYLQGTLTTNTQPNITSVGNLISLNVTGNITSGNADLGNLAKANYIQGTLTTNAQPNITSVGNLSNLIVVGNIDTNNFVATNYANANNIVATSNISANNANFTQWANANNINVTSNVSANAVKTDNLLYANGVPYDFEQPGGSNTNIQFNDSDDFGGSNAFTFNKTSNVMRLEGIANIDSLILNQSKIVLGNNSSANGNVSVIIGNNNTSYGNNAIMIGSNISSNSSFPGENSIVIGKNQSYVGNNTIYINATGNNIVGTASNGMYIKPLTELIANKIMYYNEVDGFVSYGNLVANVVGDQIANNTQPNTKIVAQQTAIQFDPYDGTANSNLVYFANNEALFRIPVVAAIFESTNYMRFTAKTVANLPLPANVGGAGTGARLFVSDSNRAAIGNFGEIVANGGSNYVPVFSDGANWRIG